MSDSNKAQVLADFEQLPSYVKSKQKRAVKAIQAAWQIKISKDTLFPVNSKAVHSDHVDHVLNNQPNVKKNLNKAKQQQLLSALEKKNWSDAIFSDNLLLETAMALFASNKITRQQFETLMSRSRSEKRLEEGGHNKLQHFSILDDKGEFTTEATKWLLPNLDGFMMQEFKNGIYLENFKYLMQAFLELQPSENYFYIVNLSLFETLFDLLAMQILNLSAVMHKSNLEKICLSKTARNAMRLACFGIENTVVANVMLGKISTSEVSKAVQNHFRPEAADYPGVESINNPHNYQNVSKQTAADHDEYHSDTLTRMGAGMRGLLLQSVKVIRRDILSSTFQDKSYHQLFSKTVWGFVDGELKHFNNAIVKARPPINGEMLSKDFCYALDTISDSKVSYYFTLAKEIADVGILCFIDMVKHPQEWEIKDFNPENMIESYRSHYQIAKQLESYFQENPIYNVLLYRIYLALPDKTDIFLWAKRLNEASQQDDFASQFSFKRNNKVSFLGLIDNKANQKPINEVIWLSLASLLGVNYQKISSQHELIQNKELINAGLLIMSHAFRFRFVKSDILAPIQNSLKSMIENNDVGSDNVIKTAKEKLEKFINHHKGLINSALSKDNIRHLEEAADYLDQFINKNNVFGFKAGFLKGLSK